MQTVLEYDPTEDYNNEYRWEDVENELASLAHRIFKHHKAVFVEGNIGRWDGPMPVQAKITDEASLIRIITMTDTFSIEFADEAVNVSELQRYSSQWYIPVEVGDLVVKQWHHDGCNILIIKPETEGGFKLKDIC